MEKKRSLNPKQLLFCQLYATDREFFGNGVQAYAESYGIDLSTKSGYATARVNSSKLLTNTDILEHINELLELGHLNDVHVDKQLAFVVTQNADFGAKVSAIKEYNKLKGRITDKLDLGNKDEKSFKVEDVNETSVNDILLNLLTHASVSKGSTRK